MRELLMLLLDSVLHTLYRMSKGKKTVSRATTCLQFTLLVIQSHSCRELRIRHRRVGRRGRVVDHGLMRGIKVLRARRAGGATVLVKYARRVAMWVGMCMGVHRLRRN